MPLFCYTVPLSEGVATLLEGLCVKVTSGVNTLTVLTTAYISQGEDQGKGYVRTHYTCGVPPQSLPKGSGVCILI